MDKHMTTERKILVHVRIVKLICSCGEEMKATGKLFYTEPKKMEYQCDKCKKKEISTKTYPYAEYEEMKET